MTTTAEYDLLDMDAFQRGEHHEWFRRLRAEEPVSWHDYPGGRGFWNVVKHADLVEINRDTETYSSEAGGTSMFDVGDRPMTRCRWTPAAS